MLIFTRPLSSGFVGWFVASGEKVTRNWSDTIGILMPLEDPLLMKSGTSSDAHILVAHCRYILDDIFDDILSPIYGV